MILPTGRGLPDWTAGTATATQGQRNVSFVGAGLIAVDPTTGAQLYAAGRGDFFMIDGVDAVQISAVLDANTIQLARPWSAATQNGVIYAIIRMSIPASGSVAKAIKDIYDQGSDAKPDTTRTLDDSTARIKIDPHSGAPAIRVGAAGAADGALKEGIAFDKDAGYARFPSGLFLPATGFRNRLINGNFDIWQRGETFTLASGAATFVADRWKVWNGNTGVNATVSKVAAPNGFSGANALNIQAMGVAPNTQLLLEQRLEAQSLIDLDGSDYVLSFDINASTSAGSLDGIISVAVNTGLDNGTFSANIYYNGFPLPAGPGRVSVKLSAANAAGLKYGAAFSVTMFQRGSSGNPNITIGAAQLEKGVVANPFEFRPLGIELALCQRYFHSTYNDGVAPGTAVLGLSEFVIFSNVPPGGYYLSSFAFPVKMRAAPSITLYSQMTGAAGKVTAGAVDSTADVGDFFQGGFGALHNSSPSTWTSGAAIKFNYTANAEL